MPDSSPYQQKRVLHQNDWITLPATLPPGGIVFDYPFGDLRITDIKGSHITLDFVYPDSSQTPKHLTLTHDLSAAPLTIGRHANRSLPLLCADAAPGSSNVISRDHAVIGMEDDGAITYVHRSATRNNINPLVPRPPEMAGPVRHEGGSGRGFSHENRTKLNTRFTNEDRGIALAVPEMDDEAAKAFLANMFTDHLIPATENEPGGAAVGIGMRTANGHYACAFEGDPTICRILQNDETNEVRILQANTPHRIPGTSTITRYLGRGEEGTAPGNVASVPEIFILDPAENLPDGFTCKALMIGSDATEEGMDDVVPQALQPLYAHGGNPDAATVSETIVHAVRPRSHDNVTAAVLPAEGMIAVADGCADTERVAELAVEHIHRACRAALGLPTGQLSPGASYDGPARGIV